MGSELEDSQKTLTEVKIEFDSMVLVVNGATVTEEDLLAEEAQIMGIDTGGFHNTLLYEQASDHENEREVQRTPSPDPGRGPDLAAALDRFPRQPFEPNLDRRTMEDRALQGKYDPC